MLYVSLCVKHALRSLNPALYCSNRIGAVQGTSMQKHPAAYRVGWCGECGLMLHPLLLVLGVILSSVSMADELISLLVAGPETLGIRVGLVASIPDGNIHCCVIVSPLVSAAQPEIIGDSSTGRSRMRHTWGHSLLQYDCTTGDWGGKHIARSRSKTAKSTQALGCAAHKFLGHLGGKMPMAYTGEQCCARYRVCLLAEPGLDCILHSKGSLLLSEGPNTHCFLKVMRRP